MHISFILRTKSDRKILTVYKSVVRKSRWESLKSMEPDLEEMSVRSRVMVVGA